jgi:hypothetical protein
MKSCVFAGRAPAAWTLVRPAPRTLLAELPTCGLRPDPGADPDTGPLYASLDRYHADHESCRRLIEATDEMPFVPAPVLVEVDYWMHTRLRPEDSTPGCGGYATSTPTRT